MSDQDKTKEELINELLEMRQRIAELEASRGDTQAAGGGWTGSPGNM